MEYHHFDPEFVHAKRHDANGITLLCATCHSKATTKIISLRSVRVANANPKCRQRGYTGDALYVEPGEAYIRIARPKFERQVR